MTDTPSKHLDDSDNYDATIPLKELVFSKLEKYPNISAKELCRLLKLNYNKYRDTIYSYRYEYRKSKQKERRVLKSLSFHNVRFFGRALKELDVKDAVVVGWLQTRAKNRMLLWKERGVGRIEWFRTGRINCWVRKPASLGKMKQLLANAFFKTGLVDDINVFSEWSDLFRLKGFHLVLDTGVELPYAKISNLKSSNGVVAVIGDSSHRTGFELQVVYPDWQERNEDLLKQNIKAFEQFSEVMKSFMGIANVKNGKPQRDDFRMVI